MTNEQGASPTGEAPAASLKIPFDLIAFAFLAIATVALIITSVVSAASAIFGPIQPTCY